MIKYLCILTIALFTVVATNASFAADPAQERYERIKEETAHTGSAGFDRRHRAYSRYVMNRKSTPADEASIAQSLQNIMPAAGEETNSAPKKPLSYND